MRYACFFMQCGFVSLRFSSREVEGMNNEWLFHGHHVWSQLLKSYRDNEP